MTARSTGCHGSMKKSPGGQYRPSGRSTIRSIAASIFPRCARDAQVHMRAPGDEAAPERAFDAAPRLLRIDLLRHRERAVELGAELGVEVGIAHDHVGLEVQQQ